MPVDRRRACGRWSRPSSRCSSGSSSRARLALVVDQPWTLAPDPEAVFSVLWLGVFGSSLAYLCYFRLLRDWGATRTSTVAYLLPVVGIVLGALVLNETLDARIALGAALIIGGVALVNSRRASRQLYSRAPSVTTG